MLTEARGRVGVKAGGGRLDTDGAAVGITTGRIRESHLLGGGSPSGHHSSTFDFDERALAHGAALMAGLAFDCLAGRPLAGR